jgi:hypothetical protein
VAAVGQLRVNVTRWLDDVEEHDYNAAYEYLTLLLDEHRAARCFDALRDTEVTVRRANDILRACGRNPLPADDPGVLMAHVKSQKKDRLSPALVVSWEFGGDIADGYHRVSMIYHLNPFSLVPLRLAEVPGYKKRRR